MVGGRWGKTKIPVSAFHFPVSAFLLVLEKVAGMEGLEPPTHG